jgi:hypothetical protein
MKLVPVAHPDGTLALTLKIACLCCENPLEWKELEKREVTDKDLDFKWLYRTMRPPQGTTYGDMLGEDGELPVPILIDQDRGGEGCVGATRIVSQ